MNLKSTVEALPAFISKKNVALFTSHGIFTEKEIHSRYEILLEGYTKVVHIEALTMLDMAKKQILPAVSAYTQALCDTAAARKGVCPGLDGGMEAKLAAKLSALSSCLYERIEGLDQLLLDMPRDLDAYAEACYHHDSILGAMRMLRAVADELETITAQRYWPFPTYGALLFGI